MVSRGAGVGFDTLDCRARLDVWQGFVVLVSWRKGCTRSIRGEVFRKFSGCEPCIPISNFACCEGFMLHVHQVLVARQDTICRMLVSQTPCQGCGSALVKNMSS